MNRILIAAWCLAGLALLFLAIPLIDPLKANIAKFRSYFDWFVAVFTGYMLFIYVLTLLWNLDYRFDMFQMMLPVIGSSARTDRT